MAGNADRDTAPVAFWLGSVQDLSEMPTSHPHMFCVYAPPSRGQ